MGAAERVSVPARVVRRFDPIGATEWRALDNNTKAQFGKAQFLELPGALDATSARVRQWLEGHGFTVERSKWVEVAVAPELAPRYVNLAYTTRSVDAFLPGTEGHLQGSELKVSGSDGVAGLTVSEERLLRAGLIRVFAVNPVRGLIGEMEPGPLLSVRRRLDGIPVGEARVEWVEAVS